MELGTKKRAAPALLVIFVMALALLLPQAVFAVSSTVTIAPGDSLATIQSNIQGAIDAAGSGEIVTVTGSKTGILGTLTLTIPDGVKVIWQADYTGAAGAPAVTANLITLLGAGTFELAGGTITSQTNYKFAISASMGDVDIIMSGGAIVAQGNSSTAIIAENSSITITGGVIDVQGNAVGGHLPTSAVRSNDGDINISGGTITVSGNGAQGIYSKSGLITITDGSVTMTGNNNAAVVTESGGIRVMGGSVTNPAASGSAISVLDGGVAAVLEGTCTGDFYVDTWGMIVEVDTLMIPKTRHGGSEGLTTLAGGDSAAWDTTGPKPLIVFSLGQTTKSLEWGRYEDVPETGESGQLALWFTSGAASGLLLGLFWIIKRKKAV